jgi:hypothetical protein
VSNTGGGEARRSHDVNNSFWRQSTSLIESMIMKHLFLLNPPHSGSTAMAKVLMTSPRIWSTAENGEGDRMPKVSPMMRTRPDDETHDYDWVWIRQQWESICPPTGEIMLEKSPTNILRVPSITKAFPEAFYVITNREPYAWIASFAHRNFEFLMRLSARQIRLHYVTTNWLRYARFQMKNVTMLSSAATSITYEQFCTNPAQLISALEATFGQLNVDHVSKIAKLKDYPPAPLTNLNLRHIKELGSEDFSVITETLVTDREALDYFGYRTLKYEDPYPAEYSGLPRDSLKI